MVILTDLRQGINCTYITPMRSITELWNAEIRQFHTVWISPNTAFSSWCACFDAASLGVCVHHKAVCVCVSVQVCLEAETVCVAASLESLLMSFQVRVPAGL